MLWKAEGKKRVLAVLYTIERSVTICNIVIYALEKYPIVLNSVFHFFSSVLRWSLFTSLILSSSNVKWITIYLPRVDITALFIFFLNQIWLMYNVVLMSSIRQSDSVMPIFTYTYRCVYMHYFYILFHYDLSQDIECSSPCYAVGPCCLSF